MPRYTKDTLYVIDRIPASEAAWRNSLSRRYLTGTAGVWSTRPNLLLKGGTRTPAADATPHSSGGLPTLPHFPSRAKRVICLFQSGGASHVDLFDNKPTLHEFCPARKFPLHPREINA
ncbi:MAG: hypothetical protein R3C12_22440 [Planctomycetaceae bacterium]